MPVNIDNLLFTLVNFTAGSEGAVNVASITITRTGLGADTDVDTVTLYDGNTKLGTTRSTFDSSHQMKFNIPSGWVIPAGTTKTLSIKGKLLVSVTGTYNSLGVLAITSDASAETATYPVMGGQMSGVSFTGGSVTIDGEGVTIQTKKIGTSDVTLASFSLEAGAAEDLSFEKITLKNIGTARDTDLANLYLMQGDTVLAGPVSMITDYATFVLDTPFSLQKSDKVTFKVVGNIADGNANNVEFVLRYSTDLVCIGKSYGYDASVTFSDFSATGHGGTTLTTIEGAELNLNLVSVALDTADEVKNVVFGTLELTASAEDTRITTLVVTVEEADGNSTTVDNLDVDELELVDVSDGTAYSLTKSTGADNTTADETWTCEDEIYLTMGVKRSLEIRGDLPSGIGNSDTYNLAILTANMVVEGVTSGDVVTGFSVTSLTGKMVTVKSASLTVIASPMNTGDAVIDTVGVELFSGILKASAASDITVSRLKFEETATNYFDVLNISKAVLYTPYGDQQTITSLTDGELDFDALSVNVPAGGAMTFGVKVDIKHTITASTTVHLKLTTATARDSDGDAVTAVGEDGATTVISTPVTTARVVTLHGQGILKFAMPIGTGDVKSDSYVLGNTPELMVGKIKVRAENEAVLIKDLTLMNYPAAGSRDSAGEVILYKADQVTEIGRSIMTLAGSAEIVNFSDLNYTVALGTEYIYIKASIRKIGSGAGDTADSNDHLRFNVYTSTAQGAESGAALAYATTVADGVIICDANNDGTYNATTTGFTKEHNIVGTKIERVALVESAGGKSLATSLAGGSNNVAIIQIDNAPTTNVDEVDDPLKTIMSRVWVKFTKDASTTISAMTIEKIGGSGEAVAMTIDSDHYYATSGDFTYAVDTKLVPGETANYLVKATLTMGGNRDWIQIDLDALDGGLSTTTNISWADGDVTHAGEGVGPTTFYKLRLDYTSVDGYKLLEPAS